MTTTAISTILSPPPNPPSQTPSPHPPQSHLYLPPKYPTIFHHQQNTPLIINQSTHSNTHQSNYQTFHQSDVTNHHNNHSHKYSHLYNQKIYQKGTEDPSNKSEKYQICNNAYTWNNNIRKQPSNLQKINKFAISAITSHNPSTAFTSINCSQPKLLALTLPNSFSLSNLKFNQKTTRKSKKSIQISNINKQLNSITKQLSHHPNKQQQPLSTLPSSSLSSPSPLLPSQSQSPFSLSLSTYTTPTNINPNIYKSIPRESNKKYQLIDNSFMQKTNYYPKAKSYSFDNEYLTSSYKLNSYKPTGYEPTSLSTEKNKTQYSQYTSKPYSQNYQSLYQSKYNPIYQPLSSDSKTYYNKYQSTYNTTLLNSSHNSSQKYQTQSTPSYSSYSSYNPYNYIQNQQNKYNTYNFQQKNQNTSFKKKKQSTLIASTYTTFNQVSQKYQSKQLSKKYDTHDNYLKLQLQQQNTIKLQQPTPSPPTNIPPPSPNSLKLSDFLILKHLGKGQFGSVKLVLHKPTNFLCALKIMSKQQIIKQKYLPQIIRQLSIQFYLSHRYLVPLYGYFYDHSHIYLLIQFCQGGQLLNKLKSCHRIPQQTVSPIIKQVCQGIDYMHKQLIIHRDVKPQNILFNFDTVKICDFGWSVYNGFGMRKTASGTPLYYPPQIVKGQAYDQKIDVWNIGMMTYQCIIGRVPFGIYTQNDLKKIVSDQITFPQYVDTQSRTKDFITKTMQKNGENRLDIKTMLKHPFILQYQVSFNNFDILEQFRNALV